MLAATTDDAAARVLHVVANDMREFAEGHAHTFECLGLWLHHELPLIAARTVDLGDARHGAQQRLDGVFLNLTQLQQLLLLAGRHVLRIGLVIDRVIEDLAQAGADRCEFWRGAFWQILHRGLQALGHELPCSVDVGVVLELQRDLRQAKLRQRAHLFHAGQAGELDFQRARDEALRFLGSERGDLGVDLHLHAGDVRHGIHRQQLGRPQPCA